MDNTYMIQGKHVRYCAGCGYITQYHPEFYNRCAVCDDVMNYGAPYYGNVDLVATKYDENWHYHMSECEAVAIRTLKRVVIASPFVPIVLCKRPTFEPNAADSRLAKGVKNQESNQRQNIESSEQVRRQGIYLRFAPSEPRG